MSELTLEIFKKTLKEELKNGLDEGFEKQAILINNAFQTHADHFDKKHDELKTDVSRIETKVDKALHTEYVNLEVRVHRLEQHTGLKTV